MQTLEVYIERENCISAPWGGVCISISDLKEIISKVESKGNDFIEIILDVTLDYDSFELRGIDIHSGLINEKTVLSEKIFYSVLSDK